MKISKRLRSTDGIYSLFGNGEYPVSEIKLAYKHYKKFGIESFIRVLRHEVLHHVCYEKGYGTDHNETFKDMCLENNACLNDIFAKGKYESLVYEGIRTRYKWEYKCPWCDKRFYTKKKLTTTNRKCIICNCPLDNFIVEWIGE